MRRLVMVGALVLLAGLLVPGTTQAEEAGRPAGLHPAPVEAAGAGAYEAELTEGGFMEFGARLAQRRPDRLDTCRSLSSGQYGSCSWEAINFFTGESFQPPLGRGRVTQVRVRVGNRGTGRMRVEVLRALRPVTPTGRICCEVVARSAIFTPRQGQITSINVNLPVTQSRRPTAFGYYIDDRLALTVLDGNVPIPAQLDNPSTPSTLSGWFPGWRRVGQERTGPAGYAGAMVLLRARWRPA